MHANLYGTSIAAVREVSRQGKTCLLDIDVQGAELVKKTDLCARFLFIAPPSFEDLEKRLRGRGTETEEKIQLRLQRAGRARIPGQEGLFGDHRQRRHRPSVHQAEGYARRAEVRAYRTPPLGHEVGVLPETHAG